MTMRTTSEPTRRAGRPAVLAVCAAMLGTGVATWAALDQPGGTALAASTASCVDTSDVIGWWSGEGSLLAEVGPAATGTPAYATGVVGTGFELDGNSSLAVTGMDTVAAGVTVEAWVRPEPAALTQAIVSRWDFPGPDPSTRSYTLLLSPFGRLIWAVDDASRRHPVELQAAAPQLFDGAFHHVAATWDGASSIIYVDGVEIGRRPGGGGLLNPAATTEVRIGGEAGPGVPFHFDGVIDEPTVWRRALTAAEVSTIVANGPFGKCRIDGSQQAKLVPADGAFLDRFGQWLGVDGDTAVVGSFQDDDRGFDSGSAYVYTRTGAAWSEQAKLLASDGTGGDAFGISVAVDGDTAVVGAHLNDDAGSSSGSAYVFTRSGTTWTQQAKLVAPDAATLDRFGFAVDIDGDTVVVGARDDDDNGTESGAAYVFDRTGTTWTFTTKLLASDGTALDLFGETLALDGDRIVVGAPGDDPGSGASAGSAYVFRRVGGVWSQEVKLAASDGAAGDEFGSAVGISGPRVVVGSYLDDDLGTDSGSAYAYSVQTGTWVEEAKLLSADGAAGDWFGLAVDLDGQVTIVAARNDDDNGTDSGSAYLFARVAGSWSQSDKLLADDGRPFDAFGWSVAIDGLTALSGALTDDAGVNSGSAYVFTL
jgi:hypothetical protein